MTRHWFVYMLTNVANGKVYVGKSIRPRKRWRLHVHYAKRGCQFRLHRAIRKYGDTSFLFQVVAGFLDEAASFAFESELIVRLRSTDPTIGYNMTTGGEGASGRPMPEGTRAKFAAWLASDRAKEVRALALPKAWAANTGVTPSRDTLEKMWAARRLVPCSDEERARIGALNRGKSLSVETRRKLRSAEPKAISDSDVVRLRESFAAGASQLSLSKKYGLAQHTVSRIVLGQTYKLAGGPITTVRGERRAYRAKAFADSDVATIRLRYARGEATQTRLAHEYGVSQCTINRVILNRY